LTITGTSGSLSHSATPTLVVQASGSAVYQISAGNTSGAGGIAPYVADEFFSGGTAVLHSVTVDTSHVTNPAPQAVYQYERYGNGTSFSYTLPNLTAGGNYTVRLHFAETYFTSAGQRVFNVSINGTQVLTNFDIVAVAGGPKIAVIDAFAATADSFGDITIQFNVGSANNPKVDGIEVITATTGPPAAPTNLTATAGNAQVSLSWTGSAGATSYNVKRSTTSGGPYSNVATGVTSTSFTDTGLSNGTTYFYVVSAVNSGGESPNSNQASATPMGNPDFTISASPSSQTVTAGNNTTYTVSVGALNSFSGTVSFSASGLPSGATASFNPTSVTGSGSSTLTVSTTSSTATGTFTLTITGSSGSLSHSTTVSLTVNAAGGGSGNAHSGTWSVKGVLTSTASYKNISQVPNAASNSTYVASLWIKGTGSVQLYVKSGNWGSNITSVRCNATSTWQLCSTPSFSTGSNTQLTFIVQDSYGTAGTLYIDDTFLGVSGGSNTLANPGFESGNTGWSINGTVFTIGQF
jgi:hypothetical protein